MSTTIEQLQRIVADDTRTTEERREAAEHILRLQEAKEAPAEPVDPALAERRAQFTGAQRRLAATLSWGGKHTNVIDSGRTDVTAISDKLTTMQIIRLMLDRDGSDGILYGVMNWNSKSTQSLADRIGNHVSLHECDPRWRLSMQSPERQEAYGRREDQALKLPYAEPRSPMKLDAKRLVRMSSEEFATFVIEFHRQVLGWDLKAYMYANLDTPAPQFFAGFVALQREADSAEESLFKGAMAAHSLATDPDGSDAAEFLAILAWMDQRERLEAERRAERIANQKARSGSGEKTVVPVSEAPAGWTIQETPPPKDFVLSDSDFEKIKRRYDAQIAELEKQQRDSSNSGQIVHN